jgi:preprotein translocase subunit SecG
MQTILIILQLFVSIALVIVVLMQKSEGGALGIGGGGGGGLFSPRGAADTLTRTTAILAVLFFLTSLALTLLALHARPQSSILDSGSSNSLSAPITKKPAGPAPKPASKPAQPALPAVPGLPSPQQ